MRLENKVAIVTGAGKGFGRGIAALFAAEGAMVVVADIDPAAGKETMGKIKEAGNEAIFVEVDVSDAKAVERMAAAAVGQYGRIDVVVNNAGVCRMCAITELSEEEWDRHLAVNLKGVWQVSKYVIPQMRETGGGSIVNVASLSGVKARPLMAAYSASKGGVIMLTKQMAVELAPHNIRVNSISPVFGETPMGDSLVGQASKIYGGADSQQVRAMILSGIPLRRAAKPEDIAYAALYLASAESSMVTGANLMVDGGSCA